MHMNIGLVLLRLTLGMTIAAHSSEKLFGWFERSSSPTPTGTAEVVYDMLSSQVLRGPIGQRDEIAKVAVFLAFEDSSFVTLRDEGITRG